MPTAFRHQESVYESSTKILRRWNLLARDTVSLDLVMEYTLADLTP